MKIHNVEQGSVEWLELRKGKVTASHAQAIGNHGKGLETYVLELMSELYSSGEREYYTNPDMERGNELEELAASMYEMENDVKLEKVGFVEHNEFAGCSPDRFVGKDGMVEIKCQNDKNYFKFLLNKEKAIDSKHIWQMQMQMLISERKWCDFEAYNPNFKTPMFVFRLKASDEMQGSLLQGFKLAEAQIKLIKQKIDGR